MFTLSGILPRAPVGTIRYEELTDDPDAATRLVCQRLDVDWEPGMVE